MTIDLGQVGDGIVELGAIVAALAGIIGVIIVVARYAILKPLDAHIRDATRQIQPGTNGGLSLSDLHRKIDAIHRRMDVIEGRQALAEQARRRVVEEAAAHEVAWFRALAKQGIEVPIPQHLEHALEEEG